MKMDEYYSKVLTDDEIANKLHRELVGGLWDEIGKLQFDYLVKEGLQPNMKLIDIGCGCLRGGIHFIKYLHTGNYFGIDANNSLIDAGYEIELAKSDLQWKLPRKNLIANTHFDVGLFATKFDYAIAQSVFTHLYLNHARMCLIQLSKCMSTGARFYVTFFECPEDHPIELPYQNTLTGVTSFIDKDPYHYKKSDFLWLIKELPWELDYRGEWGHPRGQHLLCFRRQ